MSGVPAAPPVTRLVAAFPPPSASASAAPVDGASSSEHASNTASASAAIDPELIGAQLLQLKRTRTKVISKNGQVTVEEKNTSGEFVTTATQGRRQTPQRLSHDFNMLHTSYLCNQYHVRNRFGCLLVCLWVGGCE